MDVLLQCFPTAMHIVTGISLISGASCRIQPTTPRLNHLQRTEGIPSRHVQPCHVNGAAQRPVTDPTFLKMFAFLCYFFTFPQVCSLLPSNRFAHTSRARIKLYCCRRSHLPHFQQLALPYATAAPHFLPLLALQALGHFAANTIAAGIKIGD